MEQKQVGYFSSPVQFSALIEKYTLKAGSNHSKILCNIVRFIKDDMVFLMPFVPSLTEIIFSQTSNWILSLFCGISLGLMY